VRRAIVAIAAIVIVADIALLLSGYRILINERIVRPGERYIAGQWEDVGKNQAPSIVCWYWTGRSMKPIVWWYGNGFMSKDECPFLHKIDNASGG
jgi:hypothetical protein